ncbi:hypothetical protein GCM10010220_11870 [Streptomyces parvulus]|nr:hypothetical protein GCM10010220_11870 [Streptomyces parvulus]
MVVMVVGPFEDTWAWDMRKDGGKPREGSDDTPPDGGEQRLGRSGYDDPACEMVLGSGRAGRIATGGSANRRKLAPAPRGGVHKC